LLHGCDTGDCKITCG